MIRTICALVAILILLVEPIRAQTISGVINTYYKVIDVDSCHNQLIVSSTTGLTAGMKLLLIQMQGAVVDRSNTASFGSITSLEGAGTHEFVTIESVTATTITIRNKLLHHYDALSQVQAVAVPQYSSATVVSTLLAGAWDGEKGGVLVLMADTLTLRGDIEASGLGFRGGFVSNNSGATSKQDYFYDGVSGEGAFKGEGISIATTAYEAGRGAIANGGGGGNARNSGGGGGACAGNGGRGGDQIDQFTRIPIGGEGGYEVHASPSQIIMGGGGGGGQQNDFAGSSGGAGGGIIYIKANVLMGGAAIHANGASAAVTYEDGAGGGGAGGTIILDIPELLGTLNLEAKGGNGGDVDDKNLLPYCYGPGGGGGGGIILTTASTTFLPSISMCSAGTSGKIVSTSSACTGSTYGAADGLAGAIVPQSYIVQESTAPFNEPMATTHSMTICSGEPVSLSAIGGDSYNWSPASSFSDPAQATQLLTPQSSVTYYVTITRAGCSFFDSVEITVNPKPSVDISALSTILLSPTDYITLHATPGFLQYNWSTNETTDSIIISSPGTYSVIVTNTYGCKDTASIDIQSLVKPEIGLSIPTIEGYPGDHIVIPVSIVSSTNVTPQSATDITYRLRFNRSLLVPLDKSAPSQFNGRERTVTLQATRGNTQTAGTLGAFEFIAALGDTSETPLVIDSVEWTSGVPIATTVSNGTFKLLGICPQGGNRFYDPSGILFLSAAIPNPAAGPIDIQYQLLEEGETRLLIVDMLGRTTAILLQSSQVPGNYHIAFDASVLSNGAYTIILQTPSQVRMSRLEVYH